MDRTEALSLESEVRYALTSHKHKEAVDLAFAALKEQVEQEREPITGRPPRRRIENCPPGKSRMTCEKGEDCEDCWINWLAGIGVTND